MAEPTFNSATSPSANVGHSGRYVEPIVISGSTLHTGIIFTGSMAGYAAIQFAPFDITKDTPGEFELTASNGVSLTGSAFNTRTIYDIGMFRLKPKDNTMITVYKLRNI